MAKIAIVDDERAIQLILQAILRVEGYETMVAGDGSGGISLIYQYRPDLVILDDMLPDLSGSEICRRLKADSVTRHIPIILYSAGSRMRDYKHISAVGANAALVKPAPSEEVIETVNSLLLVRQGV